MLDFQPSIRAVHIDIGSLAVTFPSLSMLRRLLSLSLLYASAVLAGTPAVACVQASPMQHCCPSAPGEPCRGGAPDAPRGMPADLACCASGMPSATATAATAALPKFEKQAQRTDPSVAISVYSPPTIGATRSHSSVPLAVVFRLPSYSTLYLSTGRLRL
jgi:hypothetical protein